MYSFCIRYAIFLLLGLSRKFAVADVNNVTNEKTVAEIFTNYLKVPWINLNSSWVNDVSPTCRNDITTFFESAVAGEMWALKMWDASSKIPSGILSGNIHDLGMYDECIKVKRYQNPANIQGRHCMIYMAMPPKYVGDAAATLFLQKLSSYNPVANVDLSFTASVCFPSTCLDEDIRGFANASIWSAPDLVGIEVRVVHVTCSSVEGETEDFTLGTILAISFFALIAIVQVVCTAFDFVVRARSDKASLALTTLAKFSLYTNALKLTSTKIGPGTMPAINGIRCLSICMIVTVHRVFSTMSTVLVNPSAVHEARQSWLATFIFAMPYTIDSFFLLSGFLSSYLFLKAMRSGQKLSVPILYLHRFLRLAPSLSVVMLFVIFIFPLLGSGPIWETIIAVTSGFCQKNWWTNLLYVQNFVNKYQMCMPHTWYLAAEMQLFWISPILLFPLFHRPKLGLVLTSTLLVAALITPVILILVLQKPFLFSSNETFLGAYQEFIDSYTATYTRASPYFVGILLGYYVANNKSKPTKVRAAFGWILSCVSILFCFWNTSFIQPRALVHNAVWEVIYVSVGRLGWSLAIAWILYACTQGYGGPLDRFLSLPMFAPLSRISYGIYLVSAVIQMGINSTQHTAEFHSNLSVLYLVCGDLVASIVFAFILTLFFETPVVVMEKLLRAQQPSAITKRASMRKKEKLLTIIREYLDLTRGRASFDSEIETRMTQPDFWRTVSEVLNTLGIRPTKSPVEWIKTWQNWKSDLNRQTGIASLENELLIFLAVVSRGLQDAACCKESEIVEPARSQLRFCGMQNGDHVRPTSFSSISSIDKPRQISESPSAGD